MLDTRSRIPLARSLEGLDARTRVRQAASFGLGSLRSRLRLLGIGTALFFLIGLAYVVHTPASYSASGQLLIFTRHILPGSDLAVLPGNADLSLVQNQIEMLGSGNVLSQVIQKLKLNQDPEFAVRGNVMDSVRRQLRVRQVGSSHLITVNFKASEPDKAARIVNTMVAVYLQELARASEAASANAPALRELYQTLGPSAHVVSEADPPVRADGPPAVLVLIAAALFGLMSAASIAILLDVMSDTVRSAEQVEATLGLECLSVISHRLASDVMAADAGLGRRRWSENQAMRRVAAAVLDASLHGLRTVGVTSTVPGEGATTCAIALAQTMAEIGKRVLLIDAVSENPTASRWALDLHRVPLQPGHGPRAKALEGLVPVKDGLHALPAAKLRPGAAHAAQRPTFAEVLSSVVESYDLVIVDMPSFAAGPDVRAAAPWLDGFLLIVKWGDTESELVRQGFQSAGEAREKFVGAILNMADETTMRHYGYGSRAIWNPATAS